VIPAGNEPIAGDLLRLELYASSAVTPRLVSYGIDLTVQTLLFKAEDPGRYTLAYGGGPPRRGGALPAPASVAAQWREAGVEAEHAPPAVPAAAPAVPLGTRRLKAAWRVVAPAARPGYVVRLELPEAVYATARADLGNLRLVAGDRQIPYTLWSPAAPALALWQGDVRPTSDGRRARDSTLEIRLPRPGLPLTELDLMAPPRPLRRTLVLRYLEPAARLAQKGAEERKAPPVALRETWACTPEPPLPCRESLPLPGRAPSVLSVRFRDGDNPPLADLDAAVWRRRDVLVFVWPDAKSVRLLVGPDTLKTPSYDLAALGDTLLGYPWQPAEIGSGSDGSLAQPWWNRWLRPVILGIAFLWLIFLLRRILLEA
jgi:hypothetical protein